MALPNIGLTNTDEIVSQATGLFSRGVSTSTIGISKTLTKKPIDTHGDGRGGNSWHV